MRNVFKFQIEEDLCELQTHEYLRSNYNVQSTTLFDKSGHINDGKTTISNKNIGKYPISPERIIKRSKYLTPLSVQQTIIAETLDPPQNFTNTINQFDHDQNNNNSIMLNK